MRSPDEALLRKRAEFGRAVRNRRHLIGLSQEELAHRAAMDRSYVGAVERGERNLGLDNIHRLANALRCNARDLFE